MKALLVNVRQDFKKMPSSSLFCHSSSDKDNGFMSYTFLFSQHLWLKSAGLTHKCNTCLKNIHKSKHSSLFCHRCSDKENSFMSYTFLLSQLLCKKVLALLINVRLAWKIFRGPNTLAYFVTEVVTKKIVLCHIPSY